MNVIVSEARKRVLEILEKETNVSAVSVNFDADIRDQINLDSMQFVGIIARLEEELAIDIPITVMEARSLNDFLGVVLNLIDTQSVLSADKPDSINV